MKNIFITGASTGIGEASARLLHGCGHTLFLAARSIDKLEKIKKELGERVHIAPLDVRDYSMFAKTIQDAAKAMGSIDVLLNNAGLGYFEPLVSAPIEDWHEMVDTNIKGVLNGIHAALPHLIRTEGHIINLGSVASHQVFKDSGVYCSTKFAVWAIGESLRLELADKIRITTISPGSVNTDFISNTRNDEMLKNYRPNFTAGMSAELIAEQINFAIQCPREAVISEIILRPSKRS